MEKLRLLGKIENLERLMQFVSASAREQGFTDKKIQEIELATEEALVNIFNYSYPEGDVGEVEVSCITDNDVNFIIELLDNGIEFDLRAASEPDLEATVTGRPIGGLGIFLIKKMVDDLKYRREGENNILTLIIHK